MEMEKDTKNSLITLILLIKNTIICALLIIIKEFVFEFGKSYGLKENIKAENIILLLIIGYSAFKFLTDYLKLKR